MMSLEFFITSLIVVLLPGTGVIYTLAVGLGRGFRASLAAALGCTLGIVPAALASIIGLAALLHTSAVAFQLIKYLGVLYLFYMAWGILKDGGAMDVAAEKSAKSDFRIAVTGTLINVLNPKLSLFFLAFLPQFLPANAANAGMELAKLALAFMAMTFVVFVGYGACAALARDYVIRRPAVMAWIKRCFATAFGALGAKLALSD
nr:LysE family translocator [Ruegeria sp. THAF33]